MQAAVGILMAAACAWQARRADALSRTGAIAAFVVGAAAFAALGWRGALVLFAFFVPSSLISRVGRARKRALTDVGKHGPRDAWQVLANGGIAATCALLAQGGSVPLAAAFAGALAAASADTWGTEIGTLSRADPRSILTLRRVSAGLSGGVTLDGTLATLGGAMCVASVAALLKVAPFWPIAIAGTAGAFIDSLLGASLQALRWCPACRRACETNPHHCGTPTTVQKGLRWLENDAVNLAATLGGAVVAGTLTALMHS